MTMQSRIKQVTREQLDNAITNIFLTIQNEYNIPTGDLAPMLTYKLDKKEFEMIDTIVECLKWQKAHIFD